jgi:hypothetical protein
MHGPRERLRRPLAGGVPGERLGLHQVGRHDRRAGQEQLHEGGLGLGLQQPRTRFGDHHGVHDHRRRRRQQRQRPGDRLDGLRAADHPDLDRVHTEVVGNGPNLGHDHLGRHSLHGGHRDRVLRGDRGDRRRPVHARRRERLEVSLDPGPATRVRPGDRQADRGSGGDGHGGEG